MPGDPQLCQPPPPPGSPTRDSQPYWDPQKPQNCQGPLTSPRPLLSPWTPIPVSRIPIRKPSRPGTPQPYRDPQDPQPYRDAPNPTQIPPPPPAPPGRPSLAGTPQPYRHPRTPTPAGTPGTSDLAGSPPPPPPSPAVAPAMPAVSRVGAVLLAGPGRAEPSRAAGKRLVPHPPGHAWPLRAGHRHRYRDPAPGPRTLRWGR